MVGALNKLPVAASGMLFFGDPVTPGSVSAVSVGFLAGLIYSVAKSNQKTETRKEADTLLPMVEEITIAKWSFLAAAHFVNRSAVSTRNSALGWSKALAHHRFAITSEEHPESTGLKPPHTLRAFDPVLKH
ncbi:hypothetical protein H0H87_002037 [Tephrocybe sp. NHM501043]|nr:hypothetical protein H0H87_002037 [Tephrocybe sp. NHM501043]